MFDTIALLVTGGLGMLGWFFAWHARGEVLGSRRDAEAALAGETSAKTLAVEASARAIALQGQLDAERSRCGDLQNQLDAERKSRQALVDALAKAGAPVGDAVVGSALDRLYPNGDQGGAHPGADASGDSPGLPGQPAAASASASASKR